MNRNLIFAFLVFVFLTMFSMVNAIPNNLHKRDLTFTECPKQPPTSVEVQVSVDPADLVPGGTNTFTVSGSLTSDITPGSELGITIFDNPPTSPISEFTADTCTETGVTCPIAAGTQFSLSADVQIPADLPAAFVVGVVIGDENKNIIGCAEATVG
jgi:hypothetical protein